jgi:endonuclease YncB( thermonuclease family)
MHQHATTSGDGILVSSSARGRDSRYLGFDRARSRSIIKQLLLGSLQLWLLLGGGLAGRADEPPVVTERLRGQFRQADKYLLRMTGRPKVIDANTLEFQDGTRVQAAGVADAPDLEQQALVDEKLYPAGKEAAAFLRSLIGDRPVSFYAFGDRLEKDDRNRIRGSCFAGETGLDMELVRNGWALAHHSGMTPYEIVARENKRGLWRGEFVIPEQWRRGKRFPGEPCTSSPTGQVLKWLRELEADVRVDRRGPEWRIIAVAFRPNLPRKATDNDLNVLTGLADLKVVELPSQPITDAGLVRLQRLAELEELNLNWTRVTAKGVLNLIKGRAKLRRLELSGVDLRDEDLSALAQLTSLESLNLRSTLITDRGLAALKTLSELRALYINDGRGKISDASLEAIKSLSALEDLDIDGTGVTDAGLTHLEGMRYLRRLQAAHTAITDAGLEHIRPLVRLSSLGIAATKVTQKGRNGLLKDLPLVDKRAPRVIRHYQGLQLAKITGNVKVLDAHTLRFMDGTLVELNGGIDGPDLDQTGKIGDELYPAGKQAAEFLKSLIGDHEVTYHHENFRGRKLHGDCYVDETCLQIAMVRDGWAVSHHTGMDSWQTIAEENHRGMWRGQFVRPELWRKGERLPGELSLSEIASLDANHAEALVFSEDAKLLAAAYGEPAAKLWRVETRQEILRGPHDEEDRWCRAVAIAPNGAVLASGDAGGNLKLWDVASKKLITTLHDTADDGTTGLAFTNDGKSLIHGGRGGIHVWDIRSRTEVAHWKRPGSPLSAFSLSHDGRTFAVGRDDGSILLCDAATMNEIRVLTAHEKAVISLAFAPGDRSLASGSHDGKVLLWDAATGQVKSQLGGGMGPVRSLAFAPDGKMLASACIGGPAKLWDLASGRELTSLVTGGFSVAFSPDGKVLATGSGEWPVKLWSFGRELP